MCNKGTMARRIEFSTTCKPGEGEKKKKVQFNKNVIPTQTTSICNSSPFTFQEKGTLNPPVICVSSEILHQQ